MTMATGRWTKPPRSRPASRPGQSWTPRPPTWVPYRFLFNSGTATSVEFVLRNFAPGGGGNDISIDDVTLAACTIPVSNSISGTVFADLDRDGIQDAGERGISGVTIRLTNTALGANNTTETDADGRYRVRPTYPSSSRGRRVPGLGPHDRHRLAGRDADTPQSTDADRERLDQLGAHRPGLRLHRVRRSRHRQDQRTHHLRPRRIAQLHDYRDQQRAFGRGWATVSTPSRPARPRTGRAPPALAPCARRAAPATSACRCRFRGEAS